MFKTTEGLSVTDMTCRIDLRQLYSGAIDTQLAMLRADVENLARSLEKEYGENNETTLRAEQLSAAIQRLEWALERQRPRTRPARVGACA